MRFFITVYFVLLVALSQSFSQVLEINEETGLYTKQDVIDVENLTKKDIYSKALEWIALSYKSANDVVQLNDLETGKIIVKGNFSTNLFLKDGWIRHTLILDFKDSKFRYAYSNFSYYSPGSGELAFEESMMSKKKVLKETEENINSFISGFKNYLNSSSKDDNW